MKLYIVITLQGGLVDEVKPFAELQAAEAYLARLACLTIDDEDLDGYLYNANGEFIKNCKSFF